MGIKILTNEEFKNFANTYPLYNNFQTIEYSFVMNKQGCDSHLIGYEIDGKLVAATMIYISKVSGFYYAYAPRGFLLDFSDKKLLNNFTIGIKKYLGNKGIMALKINPMIVKNTYIKNEKFKNHDFDNMFSNLAENKYFHMGYNNYFEALKPRFEAVVNINKPFYEIFNSFKKEVRTKIRSAAKRGVTVIKGTEEDLKYLHKQTKDIYPRDLKYFTDAYNSFNRNNSVDYYYTKLNTTHYIKYVKKIYEDIENKLNNINEMINSGSEKTKLRLLDQKINIDKEFNIIKQDLVKATKYASTYPDGIITASMMVTRHQDEISIFMDGYDKKYSSFNSKHLLIWQLIERYSKLGYKKFNLGGMMSINVDHSKYNGLNRFKLGFSPIVYEYIGDLELKTNDLIYFAYQNTNPIRKLLGK